MSISYYDNRERPESGPILIAMIIDAVCMLIVVLGWPQLAATLGPAIEWGMAHDASRTLDLMAYPYTTLWILPLWGCLVGWLGLRRGLTTLAKLATCGPLMLLVCVIAWFHLAPAAWH